MADLDIQEPCKMRYMKRMVYFFGLLLLLSGCGSSSKTVGRDKIIQVEENDNLTDEQRRKYNLFFLEAVRMKQLGELDAAFELYKHCLDIHPNSAETLYEISRFYMALGEEEKGLKALEKAVEKDKRNFWFKQELAAYFQNKRQWNKSVAVFENMSELFPMRLEPLMSLVDLYRQNKEYSNVIKVLNRIEELDGKSEYISLEKLRMYFMIDDKEEALAEIQKLIEEYPYDMMYRKILGDIYLEKGRTKDAYEVYKNILAEEPNYADGMLSLASYYETVGEDSLYNEQIERILVNANVETPAKMELMRREIVRAEQVTKDSTRVIELFDKIMETPLQDAELPMLYSEYLILKKMKDKSIPALNKVLELDPENKPARLQLLSYALMDNDLDEIIKVSSPALEYTPDVMEFYYYLGIAYYQKKNSEKALEIFEKGVRQTNEKTDKKLVSDFYAIIGDVYNSIDQRAKAFAAYDSSLVYNDNNIATLNNYAYFLSLDKKELDKAEEMSYKTIKAEPGNSTYLDTYAWILFEKGKYTEARIYIDQAIAVEGEVSHVLMEHCGDIYYMINDKEKALACWQKALELISAIKEEDEKPSEKEIKCLNTKIRLKRYVEK